MGWFGRLLIAGMLIFFGVRLIQLTDGSFDAINISAYIFLIIPLFILAFITLAGISNKDN